MPSIVPTSQSAKIFYPNSDGETLAQTYIHLYALLVTLEVLRLVLAGSAGNRSGGGVLKLWMRYQIATPNSSAINK